MKKMPEESHVDEVLLETIVREMVDHKDDVKVDRSKDDMGILLSLHLHPEDMGKVIGRSGENAKALRTIMRCVGSRNNARINIKIIEPEHTVIPQEPIKTSLDELDRHIGL